MQLAKLIRAGLALLTLLTLATAANAANVNFSGEVTYAERFKLPADAELVVSLVSLPDGRPIVSAAAAIAPPGRVPLQYSLNVSSNVIAAGRQYGLVAEIRSAQGTIFRNSQPVPVDPAIPGPTLIIVSVNTNPPDQIVTIPPTAPAAPVATVPAEPATPEPEPTPQPEPEPPAIVPVEPVAPPQEAAVTVPPAEPAPPAEEPAEAAAPVEPVEPVEPPPPTVEVAAPELPANPLLDTNWTVIGIGGDPVLPDTEITFSIAADRRAGGNGGCNNYFAEAGFDTMPLFFGPVASTRMACAPATMEQEAAYFAALDTVVSYELAGDSLSLLNAMAVPVIELERRP